MAGDLTRETFRIDAVGIGDLAEITAIEAACFGDPWPLDGFRSALEMHGAFFRCVRGAPPDERILGYLVAWFVADEGQIGNLAVREGARRRGIGAALLDAMLEAAREYGTEAVYLDVRASNGAARDLYSSRGFTEVARRKGYYRLPTEDAVILRWPGIDARK